MKIINGIKYYTRSEVAVMVGKSEQMVDMWRRTAMMMQEEGKTPILPVPVKMGYRYYYTTEQVEDLKKWAEQNKSLKHGLLKEYIEKIRGKR